MHVVFIPTGRLEFLALPTALQRIFPNHTFECLPKSKDLTPFDGFTTTRLTYPPPPLSRKGAPSSLDKIIQATQLRISHADYVCILDDLELTNSNQPDVVVNVVRDAVQKHLAEFSKTQNAASVQRAQRSFQEKVSFHLAVPMIESWIFADPAGPANATVSPTRLPPLLQAGADPEAFTTDDLAYDTDTCTHCTEWLALSPTDQTKHKPAWCVANRQQHPKAYLAWLLRDPNEKKCSRYRETHEGCQALKTLDWSQSLSNPEHCHYMRAFLEDLADALREYPPHIPSITPGLPLPHHPATSRRLRRSNPVLRNI